MFSYFRFLLLLVDYRAAYQWYSREQSSLVRDDLIRQGKDAGMGDVVKIVSSNVSCAVCISFSVILI